MNSMGLAALGTSGKNRQDILRQMKVSSSTYATAAFWSTCFYCCAAERTSPTRPKPGGPGTEEAERWEEKEKEGNQYVVECGMFFFSFRYASSRPTTRFFIIILKSTGDNLLLAGLPLRLAPGCFFLSFCPLGVFVYVRTYRPHIRSEHTYHTCHISYEHETCSWYRWLSSRTGKWSSFRRFAHRLRKKNIRTLIYFVHSTYLQ